MVKKLRKNTNAVQSAVNKLKLNKVIVDITRVHYLGLSNILFLFIEGGFDELKLAVLTLNDMPNLVTYLIENGKNSVLLALIRLPSSIVNVVAKAISIAFSEQFNRVVIHMGKYIYWGSYKPPFHLWNSQKQIWEAQ
ncbi:MAG: hypothetical protein J7L47_05830 [Candidatus Odinarchaeota archaeon]|nr:hypothetical protein [Candidatus Odinarchaeota archaeon]